MKFERTSATVFVLALVGAAGCTAYPTYKVVPLDCNAEAGYELQVVDTFEMVGMAPLWTAGDTVDAAVAVTVDAIPDGDRCGGKAALVLRSTGNNDWGSLFGVNNFGPRDESAYQGISFWARAPGNTTKAFTILLDDLNTAPGPVPADANCKDYGTDGGTGTGVLDPTGMVIPGTVTSAPEPDQCGNSYSFVQLVTSDWRFYTIPFGAFQQGPTPNRVPNPTLMEIGSSPGTALITSGLVNLIFRMPKAAVMELWIDNLGFYRKATGAGGDGGVDAPQM